VRSLALPRRAKLGQVGCGVARQWTRPHDVRVNGLLKSGLKSRKSAASFCRLFFLQVCVYYVLIEIDLVGYGTS
jgi:hypothetical protein